MTRIRRRAWMDDGKNRVRRRERVERKQKNKKGDKKRTWSLEPPWDLRSDLFAGFDL